MKLYIFKLEPQLRRNIRDCRETLEELQKIKGNRVRQVGQRQKGCRRGALLAAGIMVLLLGMTYTALGSSNVFWFTCAVTAAIVLLALLASWIACIGVVKHQFNCAVRKGYPEYQEMLCLHSFREK